MASSAIGAKRSARISPLVSLSHASASLQVGDLLRGRLSVRAETSQAVRARATGAQTASRRSISTRAGSRTASAAAARGFGQMAGSGVARARVARHAARSSATSRPTRCAASASVVGVVPGGVRRRAGGRLLSAAAASSASFDARSQIVDPSLRAGLPRRQQSELLATDRAVAFAVRDRNAAARVAGAGQRRAPRRPVARRSRRSRAAAVGRSARASGRPPGRASRCSRGSAGPAGRLA